MFGSNSNSSISKIESGSTVEGGPTSQASSPEDTAVAKAPHQIAGEEKRSGNRSPADRPDGGTAVEKKRRSSLVGNKASSLLASARNSLSFSPSSRSSSDASTHTPLQKLGKQDHALVVPQGQHNNSAGESAPGPKSTFRVGVWEDKNKKCRRTMEDTHAFLYNFLDTPAPSSDATGPDKPSRDAASGHEMVQSDNGYFAIFDGHGGTFAADWCGKKLHIILEEIIRKSPNTAIPELLDQTFTTADAQLEKLPLRHSGCTAAIAVLRWEDRVPSDRSVTGSIPVTPAVALKKERDSQAVAPSDVNNSFREGLHAKSTGLASRQRVLYTANVGDARIILCREGKALRLSYDHKGCDENEGKRITSAGGMILNNRVNGVLAVTRALGDAYMKDLVTGHPYTTETVVQADIDEFMIIACDGLWDVCSDQEAVDLVRNISDPRTASKLLVDHALSRFSTDNLSCMIVRFDMEAVMQSQKKGHSDAGGPGSRVRRVSEVDKIIMDTEKKIADGSSSAIGVSASNSGRGSDQWTLDGSDNSSTTLYGTEEE